MPRPILWYTDRPPCTDPSGCTAPRTLGNVYQRADGTMRRNYRRVCSWHFSHPNTPHPALTGPDFPCGVPGCHRAQHKQPGGRRLPVCSRHARLDIPGTVNPHVQALIAAMPPRERRAAGFYLDRGRGIFRPRRPR
jgi:hypothetical protein